jgi:hypothetical protein
MSAFLLHKSLGAIGDKSPNELRWKILSLAFDKPWCNVDHVNKSKVFQTRLELSCSVG